MQQTKVINDQKITDESQVL